MDLRPCPENVNILTKSHRGFPSKTRFKKKEIKRIPQGPRIARIDPSRRVSMVGNRFCQKRTHADPKRTEKVQKVQKRTKTRQATRSYQPKNEIQKKKHKAKEFPKASG